MQVVLGPFSLTVPGSGATAGVSMKHTTLLFAFAVFAAASAPYLNAAPSQGRPPEPPSGMEARSPKHVIRPLASSGVVGYTPAQIRHAYGLDQIANGGAGQTIGIVVAYGSPTAQNDLNVFSDRFGLPRTTIQTVYGRARPTTTDAGWALETSLDLQWAHAIAPKAKLVLSVAANGSLANMVAAVDAAVRAGAKVVSMSWGSSEFASEAAQDPHFATTGVSFFAASGDYGSTSGTMWPAVSSRVAAVGGTTLSLDASGNLTASETAWTGSGGGYSRYIVRPSYQAGWHTSAYRAYPDLALVADPATGVAVYDSTAYNGSSGWWQLGGTSASCPMVAAMVALANEQRVAKGKATLSGLNVAAYRLAGSKDSFGVSLYPTFYYDVTAGNTGNYSATPKYDVTTGLGTPVCASLIPALAAQ